MCSSKAVRTTFGSPESTASTSASWSFATASLLLYLDKGSKQVTGAVTNNTLAAPNPVVTENLQGTSTVTGTIGVVSDRHFNIAGYVNTSQGKVTTSIDGHQDFSSTQTVDFDTVNFTVLDQQTSVENKVSTVTTVMNHSGTVVTHNDYNFPIRVDFIFPVSSALFGFTVTTAQKYQDDIRVYHDGALHRFSSVNDSGHATDIAPARSQQEYTLYNSSGRFYDCQISSKNNTLTQVSAGCTTNKK